MDAQGRALQREGTAGTKMLSGRAAAVPPAGGAGRGPGAERWGDSGPAAHAHTGLSVFRRQEISAGFRG